MVKQESTKTTLGHFGLFVLQRLSPKDKLVEAVLLDPLLLFLKDGEDIEVLLRALCWLGGRVKLN